MSIYTITEQEQVELNQSLSTTFQMEFIDIDYTPYNVETIPFISSETQSRPGEQNGMYQYDWEDRYPKPFLGKTHSIETKLKMSQNNGRYWKGKKLSDETKAKLSENKKGKKLSDDTKAKMSQSRKGKTRSEATKLKQAEAARLRWAKSRQSHPITSDIDALLDNQIP